MGLRFAAQKRLNFQIGVEISPGLQSNSTNLKFALHQPTDCVKYRREEDRDSLFVVETFVLRPFGYAQSLP